MKKLQQAMDQNPADIKQMKQNGRSAIGFYCLYSPTEIAVAADAIPLPLCGTSNTPVTAAEEVLPRNLCPLIKSNYDNPGYPSGREALLYSSGVTRVDSL